MIAPSPETVLDAHRLLEQRGRLSGALGWFAVLVFPLIGGGYLKFPIPRFEVNRELDRVVASLGTGQPICLQPVLFPHWPYRFDARPASHRCSALPGAHTVLNPRLDLDPFSAGEVSRALSSAEAEHRVRSFGSGFAVIDGPVALP